MRKVTMRDGQVVYEDMTDEEIAQMESAANEEIIDDSEAIRELLGMVTEEQAINELLEVINNDN